MKKLVFYLSFLLFAVFLPFVFTSALILASMGAYSYQGIMDSIIFQIILGVYYVVIVPLMYVFLFPTLKSSAT